MLFFLYNTGYLSIGQVDNIYGAGRKYNIYILNRAIYATTKMSRKYIFSIFLRHHVSSFDLWTCTLHLQCAYSPTCSLNENVIKQGTIYWGFIVLTYHKNTCKRLYSNQALCITSMIRVMAIKQEDNFKAK